MKEGLNKLKQKLKDTKDKLVIKIQSTTPSTTNIETMQNPIKMEKALGKALGEIKAEKERAIKTLNDKSRSLKEENLKLTETTKEEITSITQNAIETMDITLATVLNQSNQAVESAIKGPYFNTTVQERMDDYIESYPQEMHDLMIKFKEEFFKDNESVECYIRMVATSVTDIGNIQQEIEEQVIKVAKEWMKNTTKSGKNKYHHQQYQRYFRC
jgi:hypothetical protein